MRKIKNITLLFSLLLAISCAKDPGLVASSSDNTIKFALESFSDVAVASTKAGTGDDCTIYNGYIFFFDSDKEYKGYYNVNVNHITDNGSTTPSIMVESSSYSNSYNLVCVFNYDEVTDPTFSGLSYDNINSFFPMDAEFLASVESGESAGMPMAVNDFVYGNSLHQIYRSVARINLSIDGDDSGNLYIQGGDNNSPINASNMSFDIVNYITDGEFCFSSMDAESDITADICDISSYDDASPFQYTPSNYSSDMSDEPKIYMYEFPYSTQAVDGDIISSEDANENDRLAILLKYYDEYHQAYRYYKINLLDKVDNSYFDIERNHDYSVVITAVNSQGYSTLEEAYSMPPSNIEYEIYDNKGMATISNGQYAISMDEAINYDNIQIFGNETIMVEFNELCYVLADEMQDTDISGMTNSVSFSILGSDGLTVTVTQNDFDVDGDLTTIENGVLTDQGQSIKLGVTGEGSCQISFKVLLGNLEVGRDVITINKSSEDGAVDAHPGQIKLEGQRVVESSWVSQDLDFGAWYNEEEGKTILYFGDNATPTGYQSMDGYVSASSSEDSYPVFSEKSRTGFYSYYDENDELKSTMVMVSQLAPAYLGHFGSHADDGSTHYYKAVIAERIEEIELYNDQNVKISDTDGVLPWSEYSYDYYSDIYDFTNGYYTNLIEGRSITEYIVEQYLYGGAPEPTAAEYCYMKNDVNGDGVVDEATEPVEWYLPAQNQALAMWINKTALQVDDQYKLNGGTNDSYPYYWTCSEYAGQVWGGPSVGSTFSYALSFNIMEGEAFLGAHKGSWQQAHIRCVRGVAE